MVLSIAIAELAIDVLLNDELPVMELLPVKLLWEVLDAEFVLNGELELLGAELVLFPDA